MIFNDNNLKADNMSFLNRCDCSEEILMVVINIFNIRIQMFRLVQVVVLACNVISEFPNPIGGVPIYSSLLTHFYA